LCIHNIDFEQNVDDLSINAESIEVPEIQLKIDRRTERRLQRKYGLLLCRLLIAIKKYRRLRQEVILWLEKYILHLTSFKHK
jgi:hypothetical protein